MSPGHGVLRYPGPAEVFAERAHNQSVTRPYLCLLGNDQPVLYVCSLNRTECRTQWIDIRWAFIVLLQTVGGAGAVPDLGFQDFLVSIVGVPAFQCLYVFVCKLQLLLHYHLFLALHFLSQCK